ncbi:MAG: 50S ribosomal protein L5 [Planctomycetota bacterium]|nr:50S ribosomal protein L5 [Planctomycetota bacterium]
MARLREKYLKEIRPKLQEELKYGNILEVPRLKKISVNMGIGKAREESKHMEQALNDLATITGQKAVVTKARKSIANFHLREGYPVGCRVTLRGKRMYEFLDRLISVAIPRIRDFRGLRSRLDGRGSYSMGLQDQLVFPEIDLDKLEFNQGMNITLTIAGGDDAASKRLLEELGMPFRRD